jgi:lipopolysaccharide export system permease protein
MGILLAFGRLYRDSEMAAIMSAGIGPLQWYRPLMLIALPTTLLLFFLTTYLMPLIAQQRAQITAEIRSRAEVDTLLVGQFNRTGNDGVLFLESEDQKNHQIDNVFFQQRRDATDHVDLAASTSSFYDDEGIRYMMMHNGIHYAGNPGESNFKIIKYKDYGVHIKKRRVEAEVSEASRSTSELWTSVIPADQAELQWRFTLPIATIIVAFMALPLSQTDPRSGRYSKLALALILYLVYSNLLSIGKTWIVQEKVPAWFGTWWVHLIAIIITLLLMKRADYLTGSGVDSSKVKGVKSGS